MTLPSDAVQLAGSTSPLRGRRLDKHRPHRRASGAQRFPESANGIGIAGDLDAEDRIAVELVVGRCMLEHDPCVITIELVAKDHRHRGIDALAHLHLGHDQRRFARTIDADEGIGRELVRGVVGWLLGFVDGGSSERNARRNPPAKPLLISARRDGAIGRFSKPRMAASYAAAAARLIAARMRT